MNYLLEEKLIKANVINISWERVNLYIDVKVEFTANSSRNIPLSFYAVNQRFAAKAKFKVVEIFEGNIYRLYLNVTNPGYARCLQRGQYNIHVCYEDNDLAICMADHSIVKIMNNFSRSFFFTAKTRVYNVFFYVDENDGSDLPFKMDILVSTASGMGNIDTIPISPADVANATDLKIIKKKKRHKKWALKLRKIYYAYYRFNARFCRRGKPKILFMSDQNNYMGTNEEALYKRMLERGLDSQYRFTFSFREAVTQHYSILSWFKLIKLIGQAHTIVLDDHAPIFEWLNAGEYSKVIQLWHAGAGFKSSGYSRWGHNGGPAPFGAHRQITYGVAGSRKVAHFFAEIWGINNENVLPTGLPRMDEYQDPNHRKETVKALYETFPIAVGKKVILFAPTYRGKNKTDAHYPYELLDFDRLYEFCGDEYVVIFKMHPWVSHGAPIKEEYKDKFVDAGPLANINDIFYITDLLITDYSSNIYEYSLMRKPILFFAFDKIPYSFSRGFHRDYDLYTPGKIVENFDEMLEAIANKDFEIEKLYEYIDEQFDYFDSNASDRIIDWAILENMPEEFKTALIEREKENEEVALLDFTPPVEEEEEPEKVNPFKAFFSKFKRKEKPLHQMSAPVVVINEEERKANMAPEPIPEEVVEPVEVSAPMETVEQVADEYAGEVGDADEEFEKSAEIIEFKLKTEPDEEDEEEETESSDEESLETEADENSEDENEAEAEEEISENDEEEEAELTEENAESDESEEVTDETEELEESEEAESEEESLEAEQEEVTEEPVENSDETAEVEESEEEITETADDAEEAPAEVEETAESEELSE
ncbi:MAG: CDP-glycerol glycerophosphotransferase family protein [Clostridia bacterium]|nr:CDP-glycerol glycerophosphotransferase family protein [Clostridia bacterium]